MKQNFWIYLSCLLFCVAIGHRVWDYERQRDDCGPLAYATSEYLGELKSSYYSRCNQLKSNINQKRGFVIYRDSMTVINYLLDNNENEKLMNMCNSKLTNKDAVLSTSKLPVWIQKYRYACLLLDYYIEVTESVASNNRIEIESEIVIYNEVEELPFEVEFEFYSLFENNVDVIYTIDGEYIPDKLGGVNTKFAPNEIDVFIKDKVTGERKKYEFNNI